MDEKRKRSRQVKFRLTDEEYQAFQEKVSLTGLSTRAYLTKLISGEVPQALPSEAYWDVLKELRAIGNNLNQLSKMAHAYGSIRASQYEENIIELKRIILVMMESHLLPKAKDATE